VAPKGIVAERDALVEEQLRGIRETLGELKASLATVSINLDGVRIAELAEVRGELAKHDAELKLLRYQMGRTSAVWSLISGAVASAIVAAVMALLLKHP
jgi:hypothetical protein